ncbi:MAG TPA: translocation/assembly module TamB domain-containing protein [Kofleriaceae bacterium]|nr:translocation/assembly module TamB domain-containing protein [Kofleriaceae bacterium]
MASRRKPRSLRRRIFRWVFGTIVAITGLLLIVLGLLQTEWGRDKVRGKIEDALRAKINGTITIGRLDGDLLDEVTIHDIVVTDHQGREVVRIDELFIDYRVGPLMDNHFHADDLEIHGLHVDAWRMADGRLNLADLWISEPRQDPETWTVTIEKFLLDGSSAAVEVQPGQVEHWSNVSLQAGLVMGVDRTAVDITSLTARWDDKLRDLSAKGSLVFGTLDIEANDLVVTYGKSRLDIPFARRFAKGATQVSLAATVDPADLRSLWPASGLQTDALLALQLQQAAPDTPWRATATGRVGAASVAMLGEARAPVAAKVDAPATPLDASASIYWSGADPGAIWIGAPRAKVTGGAQATWSGDDLAAARASLVLDADGAMGDLAVESSHVEATLDQLAVKATATATTSLGRAALEARGRLPARLDQPGAARAITLEHAALDANVADVGRIEKALGRPVSTRGAVSLRATATGTVGDLAVRARVTSRSLRRGSLQVYGLDVQAALDDALDEPTGRVAARASAVTRGATGYGAVRVDARVTDRARRASVTFELSGSRALAASGAVRAERSDRTVRVEVDRLNVRTRGVEWTGEGGHLLLGLDGRRLAGNLALRSSVGHVRVAAALQATGGVLGGPIDVDADLGLAPLGPVLTALPLRQLGGSLTAKAHVVLPAGPAHIDVKAQGVTWRGGPKKVDLALTGDLASRRLTVRADGSITDIGAVRGTLVARAPARLTDGAGWARLTATPGPSRRGAAIESLEVTADQLKLAVLARLLHQPRIAGGTANVKLTGGAGLRTARLAVDVDALEITAGPKTDRPRFGGHLDVELAADRVVVGLRADAGKRGTLTADAVLDRPAHPLDAAAWRRAGFAALRSAKVRGKGIQLSQFETLTRPVDDDEARMKPRIDLGGTVNVAVDASERARTIDVRVKLDGVRARSLATPLTGSLHARIEETRSTLDLGLHLDGQPLVSGDVQLAAGTAVLLRGGGLGAPLRAAAIKGDITLPDQPIQRLVRIVDPDAKIGGRVSGEVRLRGSIAALETKLRLRAPGVTAEGVRFDTIEVDAKTAPSGWSVSAVAHQADGGRLRLSGTGGGADHEPVALRLTARGIKLGFLAPLWRRPGGGLSHLSGLLSADVSVKGSMHRPIIDGYVRVRDGEARVPDFLRPLTKLRVDLKFVGSQVTIAVRADSRPGNVKLDGTADFRAPERATFHARARGSKLPVIAASQLVSVNGKLDVRGRLDDRLWKVDARIERGMVVRLPGSSSATKLHDTAPLDDVVYVDPAGIAAREGARQAAESAALGFRLHVKTDEKIIVRSDLVVTDVKVDLTISKVAAVTSITGDVAAERGWVEVIGRRYDIRRARVIFAGEMPPDPRLDVRVSHRFTSTTVYIDVVGRMSSPRVSFSSDGGDQDQAQLLALILQGDSPGEQGGMEQRSASAAANLLAGQVANSIRKSGLPIDALRVGTEAGAEQQITYVTVGKWLTPRLFVAYRRRFQAEADENANEGVFQHFFAQDWMWEGTAGDRGTASADLLWVVPF